MAVGACGVPAIPLTFEHVHHAEEGEREGGLPTAGATADPNLEREEQVSCEGAGSLGAPGASGASYGGARGWEVLAHLLVPAFSLASAWPGLGPMFGLVSCSGSRGGSHGDPQASAGVDAHWPGPRCGPGCAWYLLQESWGH